MSALSWQRIGNLMGERPPAIDPLTIGLLASTWDGRATDVERTDAIATNADEEMAREDAKALAKIKRKAK